jgi:ketosteroid isomerase-like protein
MSAVSEDQRAVLTQLNRDYVRSVEERDVRWFENHLAPDFMNTGPDGTFTDRTQFLEIIARGNGMSNRRVEEVSIRLLDDLAIIHARTVFNTPSGGEANVRYTDVWSRRGAHWLCVAAHITRCS